MAARKFKFVSPGVFLKEVDQSQLPRLPGNIGPVIIGRTRKGPALRPVKVNSYAEFVEVFGEPVPGNQGEDVWRDGNGLMAPAYAHYAAKAYFAGGNDSPVTVVRLLGITGDNATSALGATAGWTATKTFGIFVTNAARDALNDADIQLAAIIYTTHASTEVALTGFDMNLGAITAKRSIFVRQTASGSKKLDLVITPNTGTARKVTVDFVKGSKNYIRDVLNTNPIMTNNLVATANTALAENEYWLGETFDETLPSGNLNAIVLELADGVMENFQQDASAGRTGWVISQDEGETTDYNALQQDKLFRAIALSEGEEFSKNYVVAVEDITQPTEGDVDPYGTFSVVVKRRFGTRMESVESFPGCTLNPNSQNYIAKQIGDQYFQWSATEKRNKVYGNYPNRSKYIRVEMNDNVDAGLTSPSKIPFGYLGPVVPQNVEIDLTSNTAAFSATGSFIQDQPISGAHSSNATAGIVLKWPKLPLVGTGSAQGDDYFGAAIFKKSGDDLTSELDKGVIDYIRKLPVTYAGDQTKGTSNGGTDGTANDTTTHAWTFSLDEITLSGSNLNNVATANVESAHYLSGQRKLNRSFTATSGSQNLLELGFDKFWMPIVGGSDGVDITEADPFNNARDLNGGTTDKYAYASVDRAIEIIKDPEFVEFNIACMPGITKDGLTTKLVQTCESRADSLAIIDLPSVYLPAHELKCDASTPSSNRVGTTPINAAKDLKKRALNSSYGATYYPWVKIADTENTRELWVPPSVVALGVMAYTEKRDEVWFAPAGFNRGGLNEGNAGLPVLQTSEQLLSKQRDTLYEANINPIASFVTEGLVIFGQKTLQSTPSALDRINVRRLLIFVKKEVSRIASGLLFDQNVPATWNRFLGQVNPFLQSVKTRLGLSDYKVILDNTTTTPDLVDRNIMYAKIFLKPARAIEFIAVDFVITNTGASFDD